MLNRNVGFWLLVAAVGLMVACVALGFILAS
jgi:hypothetical protein